MTETYEAVIGLEVHVELATKTKIFCSCATSFGDPPNTHGCPVCLGYPGALPVLNRKVVEYAARAGLALGCTVAEVSGQDRKNYFYPDLPKAYQISQYDRPLCRDGSLTVTVGERQRIVGITRIHIEEDAGKLIHHPTHGTMIDHNRCGVPLIEIVSEPDLRNGDEAKAYLQKLRSVILYTGISDCRMNEGSFRCDVNLSIRKKGESTLGTRTEIKNLNSFRFVAEAIDAEFQRQVALVTAGGKVVRETRRYDPDTGKTYAMRSKESATDYRFFPDPDLPPVCISAETVAALRAALPRLPDERKADYRARFGLSDYDADLLTADRALADYFEEAAAMTAYPKLLANLLLSELIKLSDTDPFRCPVLPAHAAELATLLGDGTVNSATAKRLAAKLPHATESPAETVRRLDLGQIRDPALLLAHVRRAMEENPRAAEDYARGKKAAARVIVGKVMASTHGKADPVLLSTLVGREMDAFCASLQN